MSYVGVFIGLSVLVLRVFIAPQNEVPQTPFGIQMLVGGGGCIVFYVRIPRFHVRGGSSQAISSSTEGRSSFT